MAWTMDLSGVHYSDPGEQARFDAMRARVAAEEAAENPDDIDEELVFQEKLAGCGNNVGQRNALIMQREEILTAAIKNRVPL
jgi:hypothetical protein